MRDGQLARHAATKLDAGRAFAIATGLGPPRTWALTTGAVLQGFSRGLLEAATRDPGDRLHAAVREARVALAGRCGSLVERALLDATLVAVVLGDGELHAMTVGPDRVYLRRSGRPERLTPREDSDKGLLAGRPNVCSAGFRPGDLLLAGSLTAFSTSAVAKVVSVLSAAPDTSASVLATVLTDPAAKAGVGAAAVAARVR